MRNISALLAISATLAFPGAPQYAVSSVAGSDWVGDGHIARNSLLLQAEGLAAGRDGTLYISDAQTHRIRRIRPSGIIDTVAGTGTAGISGDDGPAASAQLSAPYGLALDSAGNLLIADLGNHRIRRLATDGTISTVASGFISPRNVAVDAAGNIYVSDFDANRVYRISDTGTVSVVADAGLDHPAGLAVDRGGALYVGDTGSHCVWKLQNGSLTKVANALAPTGLALDAADALLIADSGGAAGTVVARDIAVGPAGVLYSTDGRIVRRHIGAITTVIAGRGDPARGDFGPAVDARLNNPSGLALDSQGNLFIADRDNHRIRKVDPHGVITTFAGAGLPGNDGDGGLAIAASLNQPALLSLDGSGNLYVADEGNRRIRVINPQGIIRAADSMPDPASAASDSDIRRYFIDATLRLARSDRSGTVEILTTSEPIGLPTSIITGSHGTLYVADADRDRVWLLTPVQPPADPVTLIRLPNVVAPGMIAAVEGVSLREPEVLFDSVVATILTRSDSSIAVLVPEFLQPGSSEVILREQGRIVGRWNIAVANAAPQLFAAVNEDGSSNSPDAPSPRGSVATIYATGQGVTAQPVQLTVGGYAAEVLYSGPVSGYPGLWQINARVPGGFLVPGTLPVTVLVGGAVSPSLSLTVN